MKPFKFGQPIAHWLLRLTLVAYILLQNFERFYPINLQSTEFYFAAVLGLFALALLLGGFITKPTFTVVSGLGICILTSFLFIKSFDGTLTYLSVIKITPSVIGFYFFSRGNKS
ncbi:MAG: hypothetical protein ACLFNU_02495 [Bacteroidales bacterium]